MKKTNNYRGITLVALVITIIVLLILIGVTLQLIFSDSGAINSAEEIPDGWIYIAKKKYTIYQDGSVVQNQMNRTGFTGDIRKKHIYELDRNVYKLDGDTLYTYPTSTFTCTKTLNIFRDNNNVNSTQNKRYCKMKLYSFKIYDNDILVRNFIPCYCQKSVKDVNGVTCPPNTAGLYDIVNNEFYTNQGSGSFGIENTYEFSSLLPNNFEGAQYIFGTGFHVDYVENCTWIFMGCTNKSKFIAQN